MKFAFRTDASVQIGTGHVMRCLALANALNEQGVECHFLCREHDGNLIDFVRSKGHEIHALPIFHKTSKGATHTAISAQTSDLQHSHWLGATQAQDVGVCAPILAALSPEWLIVDHYALDARWEHGLKSEHKLMVIDDLADRPHDCDLLLDQTFGRSAEDYRALVPARCLVLCGSRYALLRPEFAALRPYSRSRRTQPSLRNLLITMGGIDKDNATGKILQALRGCTLPADCRVTVVMGAGAPWQDQIRLQSNDIPWPTQVLVGVSDMARLMAESDLAIGAAGATSWERCCLGLPTLMAVLAPNQVYGAHALSAAKAVRLIEIDDEMPSRLHSLLTEMQRPASLVAMSSAAREVTEGKGTSTIARVLIDDAP